MMNRRRFLLTAGAGLTARAGDAASVPDDEPLYPWADGVKIAPVSAVAGRHSIHSYYLASPESPDGRRVLFFTSTHPAAYVGELRMIDRATGRETVLAENVHTEDAHRVACQQWLAGGRLAAYHEVVDRRWRVVVVDVETLERTVVAEDRQVGYGRPDGDLLPLYGCHWNPGPHRDLYVWDAATRQVRTALGIGAVEAQHGEWMAKEFAGKAASIFFPVLSPDRRRVFFKLAAGNGGDDYMAKNASHRQGLVCFDLESGRLKWFRAQWGHPGWYPDSRRIFEMGNVIFDTDEPATRYTKLRQVPALRGSHPSVSPDGRLMVTDGITESLGGPRGEWGVLVADLRGGRWVLIDRFDQTRGARSWRRNDPHPAFSADGRRIYFNVGDGPHIRLMVAEAAGAGARGVR